MIFELSNGIQILGTFAFDSNDGEIVDLLPTLTENIRITSLKYEMDDIVFVTLKLQREVTTLKVEREYAMP